MTDRADSWDAGVREGREQAARYLTYLAMRYADRGYPEQAALVRPIADDLRLRIDLTIPLLADDRTNGGK